MQKYNKDYFRDLEKADAIEGARNLRILNEIKKFKSSGKLLDVGVGTGLFLKLAKKDGFEVFGVDISIYAAKKIANSLKIKVFNTDLCNINLKEKSIDIINMRHTLEHVPDPKKNLERAYQLLKEGGIIALSLPNSFGVHAKLFGENWPHLDPQHHLHFFSKKSLIDLIQYVGFKVLLTKTEELTNYDIFKLMLYKLGLSVKYRSPSVFSKLVNQFLATIGLGEGLLVIGQKH